MVPKAPPEAPKPDAPNGAPNAPAVCCAPKAGAAVAPKEGIVAPKPKAGPLVAPNAPVCVGWPKPPVAPNAGAACMAQTAIRFRGSAIDRKYQHGDMQRMRIPELLQKEEPELQSFQMQQQLA